MIYHPWPVGPISAAASKETPDGLTAQVETSRLIIQSVRRCREDATLYQDLFRSPEVQAENSRRVIDPKMIDDWLDIDAAFWRMGNPLSSVNARRRQDGRQIGNLSVRYKGDAGRVEFGFAFRPDTWGKGYGSEAAMAYIGNILPFVAHCPTPWAGGERLRETFAEAWGTNTASIRILEKCGFVVHRREGEGEKLKLSFILPPDAYETSLRPLRILTVEDISDDSPSVAAQHASLCLR